MEVCEKMYGSVHVRLTSFDSDIKYFFASVCRCCEKTKFHPKKFHPKKILSLTKSGDDDRESRVALYEVPRSISTGADGTVDGRDRMFC